MQATINDNGHFVRRPEIGSHYHSPLGELVIIAASWSCGVVFEGGMTSCSAVELLTHYKPKRGNGGLCYAQG